MLMFESKLEINLNFNVSKLRHMINIQWNIVCRRKIPVPINQVYSTPVSEMMILKFIKVVDLKRRRS